MLRERRRAVNNKPNRRLDRKSSRGMIYENEELRLRTININAEVERGQSDIRKLRRENDQLRREIWALRDEYDRLDKLLQAHRSGNNSSNSDEDYDNEQMEEYDDESSHSDDCNSCETCKNIINDDLEATDNKTNHKTLNNTKHNLHVNFDHLSIVSEENSINSNGNSLKRSISPQMEHTRMSPLRELQLTIPPLTHFENISYETVGPNVDSMGRIVKLPLSQIQEHSPKEEAVKSPKHFFAPLKGKMRMESFRIKEPIYATINKPHPKLQIPSTFQVGGNLDDLLQDIENLSKNIDELQIQNNDNQIKETVNGRPDILATESMIDPNSDEARKPFRSEINLVLHQDVIEKPEHTNLPTSSHIGFENFSIGGIQSQPLPALPIEPQTPRILEDIEEGVAVEPKILERNGIGEYSQKPQMNGIIENKPTTSIFDIKRKSRRVSLCYNTKKLDDKSKHNKSRRASIDVISISNDVENSSFLRRNSLHHNRKFSNDLVKLTKGGWPKSTRKYSRGSIDNGLLNHYEAEEMTTPDSILDRGMMLNRNSIASSRESSASISTQKSRKASITSHGAGNKIPWCACWGNGCF